MSKTILLIVGVILVFAGLIWFFQGIGLIPGSFMTNNLTWAIIGPITALIGAGLVWFGYRRKSV
jgi:hypothetical protein